MSDQKPQESTPQAPAAPAATPSEPRGRIPRTRPLPQKDPEPEAATSPQHKAAVAADAQEQKERSERLAEMVREREAIIPLSGRRIVLRRWGWQTSLKLLPKVLRVVAAVLSVIETHRKASANAGDLIANLTKKITPEAILSMLRSGDLAEALENRTEALIDIQSETLYAAKQNGFRSLADAYEFVETLEPDEGIDLLIYIYKQNTESVVKNLKRLVVANPVEKPDQPADKK